MSTPLTRRQFISRTLAAASLAPVIAATTAKEQSYQIGIDPAGPGSDVTDHHAVWVQGVAIKVPSNRVAMARATEGIGITAEWHEYEGPWDGTFKLKRGCTNPAFILADLYERLDVELDVEPDWVVAPKTWHRMPPAPTPEQPFTMGYGPPLNWQMLYDWGRWADELVTGCQVTDGSPTFAITTTGHQPPTARWRPVTAPRFTVNTVCQTREEMETLRQDLRMHCLSWQAQDPRYRTSWPGIPYPGDAEVGA